ncbi:MAG: hypothetical protein HGA45_25355, partial [Chloroflexales bacterium]|nr:hypothetical protein [Chloroflexales bacterium]
PATPATSVPATAAPVAAAPTEAPPTEAPTEAPPTEAPPTEAPVAERVTAPADVYISASSPEDAGRYLVWLGGCNDCHTVGWDASKATMPESDWLTGGRKFTGAYGTTYSANLRLTPENMTEAEFVEMMRTREVNPPMPWVHYRDLNEQDLVAIYSFLKSLGPKGDPAEAFVPPPAQSPTPAPTSADPTSTPAATPAPTATTVPENLRPVVPADAFIQAASPELAGEYFIWLGHCNACHTTDWTPTTPKSDWLTGGRKFNSAGGVAYAGNLRLLPEQMTEAEFIEMMRTREEHPPMGWFNFHSLNENDLSALYSFFVSLGPKGEPAPAYEPPK